MAESGTKSSTKVKRRKRSKATATEAVPAAPATAPFLELPEDARARLAKLTIDLVNRATDLVFEYGSFECDNIQDCPIARGTRNIIRIVKEIREILLKVAPAPAAPSTSS